MTDDRLQINFNFQIESMAEFERSDTFKQLEEFVKDAYIKSLWAKERKLHNIIRGVGITATQFVELKTRLSEEGFDLIIRPSADALDVINRSIGKLVIPDAEKEKETDEADSDR